MFRACQIVSVAIRLGVEIYNASFVHGSGPPPEEDWPWFYWGSDYPKEQWPLLGKPLGLANAYKNKIKKNIII